MKTGEIISLCALLFTIGYAIYSEVTKFFSRKKRKKREDDQQKYYERTYERKDSLDERQTLAQEAMDEKFDALRQSQENNYRMLIKAIMEGKETPKDEELFQYISQKEPEYSDKDAKVKNERRIVAERIKRTGRK